MKTKMIEISVSTFNELKKITQKKKKIGIVQRQNELIEKGRSNEYIFKVIKREFPSARMDNPTFINHQRSLMRTKYTQILKLINSEKALKRNGK